MFLLICLLLMTTEVQAGTFDHGTWDGLLKIHVRVLEEGRVSQVDYSGFAAGRKELAGYLQRLAAVKVEEFDAWATGEQLAFLLNAYNAWTVDLILSKYPDLQSIKDLGNLIQSPWKKKFIPLLGATRSLDDIEHGLIRGSDRYKEPRIHFAANCASIGCPALRAEAFRGPDLDRQLEEATVLFLHDRSRNRLDGRVLEVSSIFKWYGDDFTKGWRSYSSLAGFLGGYAEALGLTEQEVQALAAGEIKIEFLDYDWRLNSIR
ncbi:MAG: DUF547 domain-containing protein [Proteobacteria bacterium]|nr:DUF547 domain-containing protein [Pseudomonadota bacterium]